MFGGREMARATRHALSQGLPGKGLLLRPLILASSGQHVKHSCNQTSDTVCEDCEASTYTQLWNQLATCLSCRSCKAGEWPERAGGRVGGVTPSLVTSPPASKVDGITPGQWLSSSRTRVAEDCSLQLVCIYVVGTWDFMQVIKCFLTELHQSPDLLF